MANEGLRSPQEKSWKNACRARGTGTVRGNGRQTCTVKIKLQVNEYTKYIN